MASPSFRQRRDEAAAEAAAAAAESPGSDGSGTQWRESAMPSLAGYLSRTATQVLDRTTQQGSAQQRRACEESFHDAWSILGDIEQEEAQDIGAPLAMRAHLEALVERYWDTVIRSREQQRTADKNERGDDNSISLGTEDARSSSCSEGQQSSDTAMDEMRACILQHPSLTVGSKAQRWPTSISNLPRPRWTLADEVDAIVARASRRVSEEELSPKEQRRAPHTETHGKDNAAAGKAAVNAEMRRKRSSAPREISLTLATAVQCQATLVRLFHALAPDRTAIGADPRRRAAIVTWREVLTALLDGSETSSRPQVPPAVLHATQKRLYAIYGNGGKDKSRRRQWQSSPPFRPPASAMASMASGTSRNSELLRAIERGHDSTQSRRQTSPILSASSRDTLRVTREASERGSAFADDSMTAPGSPGWFSHTQHENRQQQHLRRRMRRPRQDSFCRLRALDAELLLPTNVRDSGGSRRYLETAPVHTAKRTKSHSAGPLNGIGRQRNGPD